MLLSSSKDSAGRFTYLLVQQEQFASSVCCGILLSVESVTWLAAAVMRSSGAGLPVCFVTQPGGRRTVSAAAEPICRISVASESPVKLFVGASARP